MTTIIRLKCILCIDDATWVVSYLCTLPWREGERDEDEGSDGAMKAVDCKCQADPRERIMADGAKREVSAFSPPTEYWKKKTLHDF
jgi:hypothetical protein